jgi:PhnB protein
MTTTDRPAAGVNNPPAGIPRILAHLIYEDVGTSVDWLCRVFGFSERAWIRHTGPHGRISRTQLQVLDSVITVGEPSVHGDSPRRGVSSMLYVYVDDVDAHYSRALAAGAQIVSELRTQPWGDRGYQVRDPEGHQWTFGQHVSDVIDEHL